MTEFLIELVGNHTVVAFLLSLLLNIVISVIGIIPSVFLSAFNITVFGLIGGGIVSFLGEAIGAAVAFFLYRKGFRRFIEAYTGKNKYLHQLLYVNGWRAFGLLILLRLIPFVPSSLVTLYGALGKISFGLFFLASTLGKIPALVIEVLSTYVAIGWLEEAGVGLGVGMTIVVLFLVFKLLKPNIND